MAYWDEEKKEWVKKFQRTASLKWNQEDKVKQEVANSVKLIGRVHSFKRYSDKIGMMRLKVTEVRRNKRIENVFFCVIFDPENFSSDLLETNAKIEIQGYLKNSHVEKDGQNEVKTEVVVETIELLENPPQF